MESEITGWGFGAGLKCWCGLVDMGSSFVQPDGSLITSTVSPIAFAVQRRGDQKGISGDDGVSPLADGVQSKISSAGTQTHLFFQSWWHLVEFYSCGIGG